METKLVYPGARHGDYVQNSIPHEDIWFESSDGTPLNGWFLQAKDHAGPRRALLMNHGNGENITHMLEEANWYRNVHNMDVLIYDYRGFGKSAGSPNEKGVLEDAEAAWDWLAHKTSLSADKIALFGRSLGGGVAVHLAAKFGSLGLILDRTFNSVADVAAARYWFIPVKMLIRNRYMSTDKIANYKGPLLQMHGTNDGVIDISFARKLFDASHSENKQFVVSEGTTHIDRWPDAFFDATNDFLGALK
jgi:fermentation-respiration switch protein FrsA (DUF1100 family)